MGTRYAKSMICILPMLLYCSIGRAQLSIQHQKPIVLTVEEKTILEFSVPGLLPSDIFEASLYFRNEGDISYSQKEASYTNGVFKIELENSALKKNSIEYYFQLTLKNQSQSLFYPDNVPSENPIKVDIINRNYDPNSVENKLKNIEYTILSPHKGSAIRTNDAFIAIALYYDIDLIPTGTFKLFLNDIDVTNKSDTSNYFISYTPEQLKEGNYTIRLEYISDNQNYLVTSWSFKVINAEQSLVNNFSPSVKPIGRAEIMARNQKIGQNGIYAYSTRSTLRGQYGKLKYNFRGLLTSQENSRLQPQNRYSVRLNFDDWLNVEAGHIFPQLSKFTISGRRIYGISASMNLLWKYLHLRFINGELNRKVSNRYTSINEEYVYQDSTKTTIIDTTYTLGLEKQGRGTFRQKIMGAKIAIGTPKVFQLGVHAMKVEDDTSSIFNVIDYNNILSSSYNLTNNLSNAGQQKLSNSPKLLQVQGGGIRPKGNIVAGVDLKFSLAKSRIRFHSETVASALNNNIYGGPLTLERAKELGFDTINQSDLDALSSISRLIIINENMNVLPFRFTDIGSDSVEAKLFFPTSTLGSNTQMSIVYPRNTFKIQYLWVGPGFVSLANSTIRKDIAGFTIHDRFRLFQNQMYVTLGYDKLNDNVTNFKGSTTVSSSIKSNISWYPVNPKLPRLSMGLSYRTRDNSVKRFNPFIPLEDKNSAVQNLVISSEGDTLLTALPRKNKTQSFNLSITQQFKIARSVHDATINVFNLKTIDQMFTYGDIDNISYSLHFTSRYMDLPLRSRIGFSINNTTSGGGQLEISISGFYLGGTYYFMDGDLKLNAQFTYTSNISSSRLLEVVSNNDNTLRDDYYKLSSKENKLVYNTYVFIAGAEYRVTTNQALIFDSNVTTLSSSSGFNDRVVQLRYVYRF